MLTHFVISLYMEVAQIHLSFCGYHVTGFFKSSCVNVNPTVSSESVNSPSTSSGMSSPLMTTGCFTGYLAYLFMKGYKLLKSTYFSRSPFSGAASLYKPMAPFDHRRTHLWALLGHRRKAVASTASGVKSFQPEVALPLDV